VQCMKNKISLLFVIFTSSYVFFAPIFSSFNIDIFKVIFAVLMLLFLMLVIFQNNYKGIKLNDVYYIFPIIILIPIYLIIWTNYLEINLLLSIIIGYYISKDENRVNKILLLILLIQFVLIFYEFQFNTYVFDNIRLGIASIQETKINIQSYGDVGFRPKGLFYGTLEATSFAIILSFVFRKNKFILFIILLMSLMINGRLAILITSMLFFVVFYIDIINTKISINTKLLYLYLSIIIFIIGISLYFYLVPDVIINNLLNVFNFESSSNSTRIIYSIQGLEEFYNYDLLHKLFGNSNYFNLMYGYSAESGWVNQLLNIGLIGFMIYLFTIISIFIKSIRKKEFLLALCIFCIFIAITIYRFETGFLRGILLWFFIFSSFNYLKKEGCIVILPKINTQ
jgi:hypothetical protein